MKTNHQNKTFANAVEVLKDFVDSIQHLINEEDWDEFNYYYIQFLDLLKSSFSETEKKMDHTN